MTELTKFGLREKLKQILMDDNLSEDEKQKKLYEEFGNTITELRREIAEGTGDSSVIIPINEWCKLYDINPVTARSWCLRGTIPFSKVGKWLYISPLQLPPDVKRGRKPYKNAEA